MKHNNSFIHNSSDPSLIFGSFQTRFLFSVPLGIALVFGTFGNLFVVLAVFYKRRLRTNYYIVVSQLASCDLLLLISSAVEFYIFPWIYTIGLSPSIERTCKVWFTVTYIFYFSGIYFMVLIGVLRYRAVVKPFKPPLQRSRLVSIILSVYTFGALLHLPNLFSTGDCAGCQRWHCERKWREYLVYNVYINSIPLIEFVLPVIFASVLYVKICRTLFVHFKTVQELSIESHNKDMALSSALNTRQLRNSKTLVVSIVVLTVFTAANIPMQTIRLFSTLGNSLSLKVNLTVPVLYLIGSSCVNPLIYAFGDKTIYSGFKSCSKTIFCRSKLKRKEGRFARK